MELVKATPSDSERLSQYFQQTRFPGAIELQFQRVGHFFSHYDLQSNDHVTYILQDKAKQIAAMASLIFRPAWINGVRQTVGFATDLRVSPSRKAILQWSQYFLPILTEEREKRDCQFVFSVVGQEQRQAYNAFIRPRATRRTMPRYYLVRRFKIVSLHGRLPFSTHPLESIRTRPGQSQDKEALAEYIVRKEATKTFRYFSETPEVLTSLERWPNLTLDHFLIAYDKNDNIIGCVAPWSSDAVQQILPAHYNARARTFQETLQTLSWLRLTRPLSPTGTAFRFSYLSHFYADNPDIFFSLLWESYQRSSRKEFLLYPHFEGDLLTTPPRSFISAQWQAGMYCILAPHETLPDYLKPTTLTETPSFELAYL